MAHRDNPSPTDFGPTTTLIRAGWDHLRQQNPLAAWGCWREATRLDPDSKAAQQALATLESASELPLAARVNYRFLSPDAPRRERWDNLLRGSNPEDLSSAAGVFLDLVDEDPEDAEAWFNHGLCLAWTGRNADAIESLDRFVGLATGEKTETAVAAWTLAEVLRQGRGAEPLADDLRYSVTVSWFPADMASLTRLAPELRRIPTPTDPTAGASDTAGLGVFEWLDRAIPEASDPPQGITLLATVYEGPNALRLSSPRANTLETALERLSRIVDLEGRTIRREAAPLPLPFLDAAVWTFRLPGSLDQETSDQRRRSLVESYYEDIWIHVPRHGLDGRSPAEAANLAAKGDAVLRAKLTAVVQLKEQLGLRPSVVQLYQGYPFDRLRSRLGLPPVDPNTVDAEDLSTASLSVLEGLNVASLSDEQLSAAFESASGLHDDRLGEQFAGELLKRPPSARGAVRKAMTACLVRSQMSQGRSQQALELIERMEAESSEADRGELAIWRAEIQAREKQGAAASAIYEALLTTAPEPAILALDAAETLLDNSESQEARLFLDRAIRRAHAVGLQGIARRAESLLDTLS